MEGIEQIRLVRAKPPRVFNSSATKAIKRWQFKPKVVNGIAVEQDGELKVEFICNFKMKKIIYILSLIGFIANADVINSSLRTL